jgi:hypothetical protein
MKKWDGPSRSWPTPHTTPLIYLIVNKLLSLSLFQAGLAFLAGLKPTRTFISESCARPFQGKLIIRMYICVTICTSYNSATHFWAGPVVALILQNSDLGTNESKMVD